MDEKRQCESGYKATGGGMIDRTWWLMECEG